ncbi:MarR family transcriptional regulator [Streptococcus chenjunshii]|uniref:MarR family transcriptional regulator n=1 Tax=Streptococcus chenjunshii TaxID=2173853 RepID=A0A372KN45_9STRE|nr:MarR family transcriptional regulator [Streptococcus chenjunshii]RFU51591.1 MarR family transcriptional regulator [Streptococcus chenjunshii]RFU53711.1 MarR family transcriptional regulator [Streptococcus chenjunshii]
MVQAISNLKLLVNQIEQLADDLAKKNGIEHLAGPQGHVLLYLDKHQSDEIFIKDIEQFLKISKSVSSNLIKRMEKNGFITTALSQTDKRRKRIVLTDAGRLKLPLLQQFHQDMREYLFKDITCADLQILKKVSQQLQTNIDSYKLEAAQTEEQLLKPQDDRTAAGACERDSAPF